MTLVLSRLLRSSGNKIILALGIIVMLASCGSTENLPRKSRKPRTTKKDKPKITTVEVTPKVDTAEWTEVEDVEVPPITEFEELNIIKEDVYDIEVIFPFDAASLSEDLSDSDNRFINYYGGMMMAFDILNNQGKRFNINVRDAGSRSSSVGGKLSSWADAETDLIVAPFHKKQVEEVAKYGKQKEIPVVSPWLVSSSIAKENPYYIKLMPDITDYYYAIVDDVTQRYTPEQVVIIGDNTDQKKMTYVQNLCKALYKERGYDQGVEEFIVDQDSLANGELAFDHIYQREQPLVVIIPNYSSSDEKLIYNSVRRLSIEKGEQEVIVYGMPILLSSDRMEYDYFKTLNMCVARSKYVDQKNDRVIAFKSDYLARFGAIPTEDAYEGYDMMMYIGENLWKYGKNFQYHLDTKSDYYLQSAFDVQVERPKDAGEDFTKVDYFVNKNIDIIRFVDNRFRRD